MVFAPFFFGPFVLPKDIDDEEKLIEKPALAKKFTLPNGSHEMECTNCNKRSQWAEPNQEDGTFICYECRIDESK